MLREFIASAVLLAVVASLLVPLPPGALDFLLVGNLVFALLLLVSTLYVTDSLKLSALPTILLIATLYRLALNVATTRQILSYGDAGKAVEAFGSVVAGNNVIIGLILFMVITLLQFLVIAKGSERVAEVAARFALDALPGKQMSIDADVRAGLIDFDTARRRRWDLQIESRFFGALDGAMKFIKGDAVVGLLIVGVNIVGGLAIGIFAQGLDFRLAVSKYTILTVGDGLLAQIPALLNALAAGLVVTRVNRDDNTSLAQELVSQIGQVRKSRLSIAAICIFLAFVPGMPSLAFFSIALILCISASLTSRSPSGSGLVRFEPRNPALFQIILHPQMASRVCALGELARAIQAFRQELYEVSGLLLPPPEVISREGLVDKLRICMRGVKVRDIKLPQKMPQEMVRIIATELGAIAAERAVELVDDLLTRRALDLCEREAPELVSAAVPGAISLTQLTVILKFLVSEGISIRNLDLILQAIVEAASKCRNERALLEDVRVALRRVIVDPWLSEDGDLEAYMLDPVLDMRIAGLEQEGKFLTSELLECFRTQGNISVQGTRALPLIASKGARRLAFEGLKHGGHKAAVLAYEEIPSEVRLIVIGHIAPSVSLNENLIEELAA